MSSEHNDQVNDKKLDRSSKLGPCGACKYLRRKCIKGCVFAPYFNADEGGAAHFAAVHRVFGASNAAKLLHRIPANRRREAVVTLSYEALSRVRDPVYGCVSQLFSLHQQVLNMQAELALVQARLSNLQCLPPPSLSFSDTIDQMSPTMVTTTTIISANLMPSGKGTLHNAEQTQSSPQELTSFCSNPTDYNDEDVTIEDGDLQILARELVSKYLPEAKFKPEPK